MIGFKRIKLERIQLEIMKSKGILSGLKCVQLSDLHIARYGPNQKKIVHLVNRENPDLILITGDMVVNYENDFSACLEVLRRLKSRHGLFAVFGNSEHTFKPVQHLEEFALALDDIGVTLLNNRHIALRLNGQELYLIGVDDPFFLFDDFETASEGVPPESPTILLAHSPDILFSRADALVVNLLESASKKDHFKHWGWEDSSAYSPEHGDVYFERDGVQTLRVQSRQVGVSVDTILLNPYPELDKILEAKDFEDIDHLLKDEKRRAQYPALIVIPASDVEHSMIHGKWKKEYDSSALFRFHLDDLPLEKVWRFQPEIDPKDHFEAEFQADKNVKYHLWIRIKAYKGSPLRDSVFCQFSDSVDEQGRERFRIGKPAYSKERLKDMDLILTGHTHGGQIKIPFYGPLVTLTSIGKKYTAGLYHLEKFTLYVSRGIGYSTVPIRLFCPPEITIFEFR